MSRRPTVAASVGLVVMLGICSVGQSGVIRDDRDPQLYVDLGASGLYASVGRVDGATASSNFLASGTLISQDWVLTAAHVVQGAKSLSFTVGATTYPASGWVAHSSYNSGNLVAGYDIAMIRLASPATGIVPATRYSGSGELGSLAVAAGYGKTGTGLTGATSPDFRMRAGENMVDAFYPVRKGTSNILLMDFDNPYKTSDNAYGLASPLDLEYLIAPGDSGGGLFADFGLGPQLIGIHSFCWGKLDGKPDSDYGDVSGHTRVSVFNSWIDDLLSAKVGGGKGKSKSGSQSFLLGEYEFVFFDEIAVVPEPATLSLLALGGLAMLRRRRRYAPPRN